MARGGWQVRNVRQVDGRWEMSGRTWQVRDGGIEWASTKSNTPASELPRYQRLLLLHIINVLLVTLQLVQNAYTPKFTDFIQQNTDFLYIQM